LPGALRGLHARDSTCANGFGGGAGEALGAAIRQRHLTPLR
jgi:hypothetical protein